MALGEQGLEFGDPLFERFQLLAGSQEDAALDVEFAPRNDVEPFQRRAQDRAELILDFAPEGRGARRDRRAQAASDVVEVFEIEHGEIFALRIRGAD